MVLQGWRQHAGGEFQGLEVRKGAVWPWAGCFPSLFGEVCGRAFRDPRRECDFILSPWGLLQEGALVPRSACGSSHAWPTGVTHSRCAHIRCAVNPRRKVPGRTQWRHCSGGPLGCVSHCRTHTCLTPTTLLKEDVGPCFPGPWPPQELGRNGAQSARGPRQPDAGFHLPAPGLGHRWGPGMGAGCPAAPACSVLVQCLFTSEPWCGACFWLQTKKRLRV